MQTSDGRRRAQEKGWTKAVRGKERPGTPFWSDTKVQETIEYCLLRRGAAEGRKGALCVWQRVEAIAALFQGAHMPFLSALQFPPKQAAFARGGGRGDRGEPVCVCVCGRERERERPFSCQHTENISPYFCTDSCVCSMSLSISWISRSIIWKCAFRKAAMFRGVEAIFVPSCRGARLASWEGRCVKAVERERERGGGVAAL